MSMLQVRITGYDCLANIEWSIRVEDLDDKHPLGYAVVYTLSGSMPGRGSADPTRWLRELLEELREHM